MTFMKPIPFDPKTDLAPVPFQKAHLELARKLKQRGLGWRPHVGCFVWDAQGRIKADSPFPLRIYFILSLPRFIDIFGNMEKVAEELVWLPTWHQARLTAARLGARPQELSRIWSQAAERPPGEELMALYRLIESLLSSGRPTP